MALMLGGEIVTPQKREYGHIPLTITGDSLLFTEVSRATACWMSHTDQIARIPQGFAITAHTAACPAAALEDAGRGLYAVQFHPEVQHTPEGGRMLRNFLYQVCGCSGDWQMSTFVADSVRNLKNKIGGRKVLCAMSGGVDSSVAAVLIHQAVGRNLTCIFVDHGLLRKNEGDDVERVFKEQFAMNLVRVNARQRGAYGASSRGQDKFVIMELLLLPGGKVEGDHLLLLPVDPGGHVARMNVDMLNLAEKCCVADDPYGRAHEVPVFLDDPLHVKR
jgi:GMP synthase (glutamine-hydrolysing)